MFDRVYIFCSIVDILFKLDSNVLVLSDNMFGKFGKDQRKTEGDREIESDLHENQYQMQVESKDNQVLDCILLRDSVIEKSYLK